MDTGTSAAALVGLQAKLATQPGNELRKAARGLEAHFVHELLRTMRRTARLGPDARSSQAEMYDDMVDQAVADKVAESGRFGIGEVLYRQLVAALPAAEEAKAGDQ
jgi:Rod binding domain-containing protein